MQSSSVVSLIKIWTDVYEKTFQGTPRLWGFKNPNSFKAQGSVCAQVPQGILIWDLGTHIPPINAPFHHLAVWISPSVVCRSYITARKDTYCSQIRNIPLALVQMDLKSMIFLGRKLNPLTVFSCHRSTTTDLQQHEVCFSIYIIFGESLWQHNV